MRPINKKTYWLIGTLLLTVLVIAVAGCGLTHATQPTTAAPTTVFRPVSTMPDLVLVDGDILVGAARGTSSWHYLENDKTGTYRMIEEDGPHPMDPLVQEDLPVVRTTDDQISYFFNISPGSYTIRYWSEAYVGTDEYESTAISVEPDDNKLLLPSESGRYIYEVHAVWPQADNYYGDIRYMFAVEIE